LTLIFEDIVDSTDNYKYYRERWQDAPGLPFVLPHTYGPMLVRKLADFFRFREYPKWRSDGNVDDLAFYLNRQNRMLLPAHNGSWPVFVTVLAFLWQQLFLCLGFTARLAAARRHRDLESGLQVNTKESPVMSDPEEKRHRLPFSVDLKSVISSSKSCKSWKDKIRTCSFEVRRAGASYNRIPNWKWDNLFSIPRRVLAYLWFLVSSLCLYDFWNDKPFSSDPDEHLYLLDLTYTEHASALANKILSALPEANGRHVLLLTQGPPKVQMASAKILLHQWSLGYGQISSGNADHQLKLSDLNEPEDLIRQIGPELPQLPLMDPRWSPPGPDSNMTTKEIAGTIDSVMSLPFYLIPFAEFRLVAYGHDSELVGDVLNGIFNARCKLCQLLVQYPELRRIYTEVKKVSRIINRMDNN
jgi:hypothetical protein